MDAEAGLSCRQASRLLSLACERALDEGELEALKRHLDECLMCRNFASQLDFLRKASRVFSRGE